MNELPKSVRDELARQGKAEPHPDADLLTAYSEGTATPAERTQIEQHLATCEDCREVIYLAAPETPAEAPDVVVAKPHTRWLPTWAPWTAAAAVLIVATFTFTHKYAPTQSAKLSKNEPMVSVPAPAEKTSEIQKRTDAQKEVPQPDAGAIAKIAPSVAEPSGKDATLSVPTTIPSHSRDELKKAESEESRSRLDDYAATAGAAVAPAPAAQQPVYAARSNAARKPGPAAPAQNQMQNQATQNQMQNRATQNVVVGSASETVEVTSESAPVQKSTVAGMTTAEISSAKAKAINWRISPSGAVERELSPGGWETALTKPDTEFSVVAVIGPDVWAGGTHGSLYNSIDGGKTWKPIYLPGIEGRTVTAIEFRDVWHGVVTTADHHSWTTADRGNHWQQH